MIFFLCFFLLYRYMRERVHIGLGCRQQQQQPQQNRSKMRQYHHRTLVIGFGHMDTEHYVAHLANSFCLQRGPGWQRSIARIANWSGKKNTNKKKSYKNVYIIRIDDISFYCFGSNNVGLPFRLNVCVCLCVEERARGNRQKRKESTQTRYQKRGKRTKTDINRQKKCT